MSLSTAPSAGILGRRAVEHAKQIARPRRTGSSGEAEVRRYIVGQLRSLGFKVSEEPFAFRPMDPGGWRLYLTGLAILALLTGTTALSGLRLGTGVLAGGLLLFGLGAAGFLRHSLRGTLQGREAHAANVFAAPAGPPCLGPRILLCAHYDSKSQSVSLRARIVLILAATIGTLLLFSQGLAVNLWPEKPLFVPALSSAALLLLFVPLWWMRTHDRSPGAADNAAAVGVLLELAERLRLHGGPPGREIAFLFSAAEEEGAVGAMAFLGEHTGALHERPHEVINLDILGPKGTLYLWGGGRKARPVEERLRNAARKEQIRLRRLPLVLGALADHLPFASAGIPAVTLTSPLGVLGKVHTARDRSELLREARLGEAVRLLESAVRSG